MKLACSIIAVLSISLLALADWPNAGVYVEAYIPVEPASEFEAMESLVCRIQATNAAHVVEVLDMLDGAYDIIRIDQHEHWLAMSGRACVVQPIRDYDGTYHADWTNLWNEAA